MVLNSLINIFKYSKHLLRNVDPKIISKFGLSNRPLLRLINGNKYVFRSYIHDSKTLCCYGDILCGLYFPNNKPGDEVSIIIKNKVVSTLKINKNNKIYLPINDLMYIPLLNLSWVKIDCSKKFYCIYMSLQKKEKEFLLNSKNQGILINNKIYNRFFQDTNNTSLSLCENSFQMIYYKNLILKYKHR